MGLKKKVIVKTSFIGFHRWLDAPKEVQYLQNWHRHLFNVKIWLKVKHSDRQIEFFMAQRRINEFIKDKYNDHVFEKSCEMIAEEIMKFCDKLYGRGTCTKVQVFEDNENGGEVEK
jgi:metal-dependent HD superfamily phosphatase/phosphodiesterase